MTIESLYTKSIEDGSIRHLELHYDTDAMNPRDPSEYHNLGKIISFKSDFTGDENCNLYPGEWLQDMTGHSNDSELNTEKYFKELSKDFYIMPITLHIYSSADGIHLSVWDTETFNDRDESNCDGFVYVRKDNPEILEYLKENGQEKTDEWIKNVLKGEVDIYQKWCRGEVYGVSCDEYNPENKEWNDINSYWTFYADDNETLYNSLRSFAIESGMINENDSIIDNKNIRQELDKFDNIDYVKPLFFNEAKKLLPDYNNNPEYAFITQLKIWAATPANNNRADMIKEYMGYFKDKKDFTFELLKGFDYKIDLTNLHQVAAHILPAEDIDHHHSDLYLDSSEKSDWLINQFAKTDNHSKLMNLNNGKGDGVFFNTFKNQLNGKKAYDIFGAYSPIVADSMKKTKAKESQEHKKDVGISR